LSIVSTKKQNFASPPAPNTLSGELAPIFPGSSVAQQQSNSKRHQQNFKEINVFNIKTVLLAALLGAFALPAFADDPSCESCVLPNDKWSFEFAGSDSVVDTVVTPGEIINQAQLASGGRASDKNRSNFQQITTSVVETTTNYFEAINPQGKRAAGEDVTETFTNVISSETVKIKIK